jgi:hypothetical protein
MSSYKNPKRAPHFVALFAQFNLFRYGTHHRPVRVDGIFCVRRWRTPQRSIRSVLTQLGQSLRASLSLRLMQRYKVCGASVTRRNATGRTFATRA